jgi:hypothetical protein
MKFARLIVLCPLLLALAACGTVPPFAPLPSDARDKIASTEIVVPIKQSEIYVFVPASNVSAATGGGLLWALVDAGVDAVRTKKAETAVTPLRDALVDYNFDDGFRDALKSGLADQGWLHVDTVHVVKTVTNDALDADLKGSKDAAVLFLSTDYNLDNDGNVLTVSVYATLFPNSDALKAYVKGGTSKPLTATANSIYHDTLVFHRPLDGATDDRDANIAKWSADKGAMMREALGDAGKRMAQKLVQDLARNDVGGQPNDGEGLPVAAP